MIHLRNQDETAGSEEAAHNRFEKPYHHRDHRYVVPPRLDREQLHGPKTISKSINNTNRTLKNSPPTQVHSDERSSRTRSRSKTKDPHSSIRSNQRTEDMNHPSTTHTENGGMII